MPYIIYVELMENIVVFACASTLTNYILQP